MTDTAPLPQWARALDTDACRPRGRLTPQAALGARTWFRVGGAAELLFQPASAEDLAQVMQCLPLEVPVLPLGACSNVIVRDGGIDGLVVRLARGFATLTREGDGLVAGAACLDMTVAEHAAEAGLAGLEFLAGIPGSIGGAVAMNAGAYGSDMAAVLDWVEVVTRDGRLLRLPAASLDFSYRHATLPPQSVVVRVRLAGLPASPAVIRQRIAEIRTAREAAQPVRARTGGSTFRNPDPDESGRKAWELIDAAGCRGLRLGGAQMSEKHCNFMLNTDNATAADLEGLGDAVRQRVHAHTGVTLRWEIRRIGRPAPATQGIPA
ncbi:UDP-N-acetylenolpyruvoylglucosamine reductase [Komagataeibacter rhaeticus]|uniref:UDP-N-acetylenolpyruvoylglucosamine reductase n=1 Tax=Komagataeibacter rhaeticus TaxID=215221 RepID=A0A181CBT1_9PROT|nr:UDP-N-acetylmuramate dehydrogenase [Komagataeibacter rhaeticus]ATU72332.1 UDP-N-acetylenolpyruvoylglucosamine reductase [Komagataeibacter xylinus]EGG74940.1 UDP-N-acetylenolpyruvoylglucosamine reductase [Gluconacetobacter sp. SXCC-1]KDU96797.1 UDP-N-acetylenolpyruvoylglucosamine reductase [Komagataeibacter rhaeticus AF1]MBL7240190.1 UDP-N-acetylmuramate dehydrogenase [Komagataeibacter rhaeticus]PYD52803.1 UDP-N-acetylenolpyruvoylglucosamine reductase [Komagataeibacter rhaeticus]